MSDYGQLLNSAQQGNEEAFIQLFALGYARVRGVVSAELPIDMQRALAHEEVLQDTYLDAWAGIQKFENRGEEAFVAWLIVIAKRNILNAIKSNRALKRGGGRQPLPLIDARDEVSDQSRRSPSMTVAWREAGSVLNRLMDSFGSSQRELIRLHYGRGMTARQIGALLGKTPNAVSMSLRRIEAKLRRRYHRQSS